MAAQLDGRIAFVTGAGSGIGKAIAQRLVRDGAAVAFTDVNVAGAEAAVQEMGEAGAVALELDVTRAESVAEAVRRTEMALGPIDILVNSAGYDKPEPFLQSTEEVWDRLIAVNYKGTLVCCKAALPGMVERGRGAVVNIGSDAGRVGSGGEAVYSGTKGAVIAFTKTLAREMARHHINVNCVCPGPTDTPMFRGVSDLNPRLAQALEHAIPWRRLGQPEDIAGAVAFLVSPDAGYITGQTLSVSGGLTMI